MATLRTPFSSTVDLMTRAALVAALLAVSALAWWALTTRTSRFRPARHDGGDLLTAQQLGSPLGARATLVQLSAATCSICPRVAAVLRSTAAGLPGVAHVELRVEDRMDLVERYGVLRTPTVLLLDADGGLASRMSGPLDRETARAAIHAVTGAAPTDSTAPTAGERLD
ncbi:thioredoxin family protein [Actinotalea sp. BY-33]|uniref:Thioredoxin family protein n=1 Tax=Actinotalea soli TaxID=2819234 RepID=A0A939LN39_9CELL|nr:thioredoxin family protein [Actinotalea soli]MBO1750374.1 thioredoxin family protein [Actinotalea soli]